jgi:uncharacterized protein (DUF302 family)
MATSDNGVVTIASQHSFEVTIERVQSLLKARGVTIFAVIDFSGDAARAGLALRPEKMLIFGNPKAGTPLMVESPPVGLDLPLKALIWEDANARTWIAYNDPAYIVHRHGVSPTFVANLAAPVAILEQAARRQ